MNKISLFVAALTAISSLTLAPQKATATRSVQVQESGLYNNNKKYFDLGVNGKYKSYGILEFGWKAGGKADLVLSHADYKASKPTKITVYEVEDIPGEVEKAGYDSSVPGGYSHQFGGGFIVGKGAFQPGAKGARDDFHLDHIRPSKSGVIRLLLTADEKGYATYFGVGADEALRPVLKK